MLVTLAKREGATLSHFRRVALEVRTELLAMLVTFAKRGQGDTFALLRSRAGGSDGAPGYARHAPTSDDQRVCYSIP